MICYGVVDAICSFAFGRLVQFVGHAPFFLLGKISEMQSIIVFIKKDPMCGIKMKYDVLDLFKNA